MISNRVSIFILACSLIASIKVCYTKEIRYEFLEIITYSICEGKESSNYTLMDKFTRDATCAPESSKLTMPYYLLSSSSSSRKSGVNVLQNLALSVAPKGAMYNVDSLNLVVSGPLEGNYVYYQEVGLEPQYLKICTSVLGYSYVKSITSTLLISNKLDINVLISPTGGFEQFKKGCTTQCSGTSIIVSPVTISTN